jgi:hypothetical protein
MSAIEEDIVKAKENLQNALGERYIEYLYLPIDFTQLFH